MTESRIKSLKTFNGKRNFLQALSKILIIVSLVLIQSCQKKVENPTTENVDASKSNNLGKLKSVDIELIADNMISPLGALEVPDGTNRLFIYDQIGKVW